MVSTITEIIPKKLKTITEIEMIFIKNKITSRVESRKLWKFPTK